METWLVALVAVLFFVGLGAGLLILSARLGGWTTLARAYYLSHPVRGQGWWTENCRLVRMKWEGFEPSLHSLFHYLPRDLPDEVLAAATLDLKIRADSQGFSLATLWFGPLGYPPVFVPWADVAIVRLRWPWAEYLTLAHLGLANSQGDPNSNSYVERLAFRFRQAPLEVLLVNPRDGDLMAAAAGPSWPGILSPQDLPDAEKALLVSDDTDSI